MTQELKNPKVIVIGDVGQGSFSDAIKQVIDNQLERGITINEMLEKDKSLPYFNFSREIFKPLKTVHFDKPKSKFHR